MADDQHELVVALKELALQLGLTPTRAQCEMHIKNYRRKIDRVFEGSHHNLVMAAGLTPPILNRKLTNKIFEKDIDRHLDEREPPKLIERLPWPKIAILGDIHEPFSLDRIKADFVSFCQSFQPEYIVQIGDAMDMYSHTKFPRSHNVFTPKDEETRAKKNLEELWSALGRAAPRAKRVGLLGNHDVRPLKRVLEQAPSFEHWIEKYFNELFQFDGVEIITDPRQEYFIQDIAFLHGYLGKLGDHRDFMLMNAVRGHDHIGGCVFRQIHGRILFELDAGFAGDPESKGLSYTNQKMSKQTKGFASIDALGPRFIPK